MEKPLLDAAPTSGPDRRFPDDKAVLFFDGVCVLCSGFARYILKHDRAETILLCTAQSDFGQYTYRLHGLDGRDFKTNLLVHNGKAYTKSDAFIQAMWLMGGLGASMIALRLAPRWLRNAAYDPIARNRYRWFGENAVCFLPSPDIAHRFIT